MQERKGVLPAYALFFTNNQFYKFMGKVNEQNLIPMDKRSKEEARELGQRGGIASGQSRSFKALLKQIGEEAASAGSPMQRKEYVARKLYELAGKGNIKAMELIMKATNELEDNITLNVKQPRDLTPEEAQELQKQLEETY